MGIFSWQPRRACLRGQHHHVKHAPPRARFRGTLAGQIDSVSFPRENMIARVAHRAWKLGILTLSRTAEEDFSGFFRGSLVFLQFLRRHFAVTLSD